MQVSEVSRAVAAAKSIASALGLAANDAVVLHNSNKLAVRLLPWELRGREIDFPDRRKSALGNAFRVPAI